MADMITQGVHGCSREDRYVYPKDPLIQQRLEWFQDQKLALMMHYGPYSQLNFDDLLNGKIQIPVSRNVNKVVCLADMQELEFHRADDGIVVTLSHGNSGNEYPAVVFRIE